MKKVFVSLIAILALAVSTFAQDLPGPRHVADIGSAFEFTLPAATAPSIVTAPVAWLSASNLRMCRAEMLMTTKHTAIQRSLDRETYATKIDHAIGHRPRAVTHGRFWRV